MAPTAFQGPPFNPLSSCSLKVWCWVTIVFNPSLISFPDALAKSHNVTTSSLLVFSAFFGLESIADPPRVADVFITLNIVRILSIIALILVFSSSILVMVHDITAVNSFMSAAQASGNSTESLLENCDYIEYVITFFTPKIV